MKFLISKTILLCVILLFIGMFFMNISHAKIDPINVVNSGCQVPFFRVKIPH